MASIYRKGLVLAGLFLLTLGGTAHAALNQVVKVNVPFDFVVNGQTMPAGRYEVERDDQSSLLMIRGDQPSNHTSVFVLASRDGATDPKGSDPVLTFKHFENTYQLASVWDSQDDGFDVITK